MPADAQAALGGRSGPIAIPVPIGAPLSYPYVRQRRAALCLYVAGALQLPHRKALDMEPQQPVAGSTYLVFDLGLEDLPLANGTTVALPEPTVQFHDPHDGQVRACDPVTHERQNFSFGEWRS
jgi:hypothetical protein